MFAVIAQGGKQYRVEPGMILDIELIPSLTSTEKNTKIELYDIRAIGTEDGVKLGSPTVAGAKVLATLLREKRARKVLVFKKKKTKMFRKRRGHRQDLLEIRVESITG